MEELNLIAALNPTQIIKANPLIVVLQNQYQTINNHTSNFFLYKNNTVSFHFNSRQ